MSLLDLARPEIRALEPYSSARSLASDEGILLNANESPWPPDFDPGRTLHRYPDPQPQDLKARLAAYYQVDESRLLITRGSDEGIDLLVRAFCAAGKDAVTLCPPCFGMYALSARIQGADVQAVALRERDHTFELDTGAVLAAPARLTFLCSPNNPTGNLVDPADLSLICQAREDQGLVVIDEAYQEFHPAPSAIELLNRFDNLVVLRTLSKAFALAGCRIGVVIAHPDVTALLARILPPYPLPAPAVSAALEALQPDQIGAMQDRVTQVMAEKQALVAALEELPRIRRLWPGNANFVLIRTDDGPGLVARAAEAGIRLRDQSGQTGLSHCVRITVGSPEENQTLLGFLRDWSTP